MAAGWLTESVSDNLTLTSAWQDILSASALLVLDILPNQELYVQPFCDFQATPANHAEWRVLSRASASMPWSTDPVDSGRILNTTDLASQVTLIARLPQVKFQMRQSGTGDTANVGRVYHRLANLT